MPERGDRFARLSRLAARALPPDPVLGGVTAVLIVVSVASETHRASEWIPTLAAAAVAGGAIAVRGRYPLGALATATVTFVLAHLAHGKADAEDASLLAELILLYTVAARVPLREAIIGLVVAIAGTLLLQLLSPPFDPAPPLVLMLPAFFIGRALRRGRLLTVALDEHTSALRASRQVYASLAVRDERLRIARELHDVVGHAVSLMAIQASAGRRVASTHPELARQAIDAVDQAGAQALEELSRLAGLLEPEAETTVPSLTALIASTRKAGLDVRYSGDGGDELDPLAYRVVQEALTNVLKHAGPTRVDVHLEQRSDKLEVCVTDHGSAMNAATRPVPSGGHGLAGMRERVALAGGTLTAGPTRQGGWEVTARVPADRLLASV